MAQKVPGMMPSTVIIVMLSGLMTGFACASMASNEAADGEALFEYWCAPCHGRGPGIDGSPMLPGTATLQRRYQGKVPAYLPFRKDLTYEALEYFVRNGRGAMPSFRKTELSNEQLKRISAWIREKAVQHSPD